MKKLYFLSSLLLSISFHVDAQTDQQRINDLDKVAVGGQQQMFGKSLPPPGVEGSTFYNDDWYLGEITFITGKIYKDYFIRYDIASGMIETKKNNKIVSFHGEDIQKFYWYNDYSQQKQNFISSKNYKDSGIPLIGFFELVQKDDISLLSYPKIKVKDPDYVEGLDVGNRNYEVKKVEGYYFAFDDELYEIKKSKGKNIRHLKEKYPSLKKFVEVNDLSFKDRIDLIEITEFLNNSETHDQNF